MAGTHRRQAVPEPPSCSRSAQGQGCSQAGCSPELERPPSGRGLSVGVEPSGLRDAPDILLPAATVHVFAPTCLHPPSNFPGSVTVGPAQRHFCAAQRLPDGFPSAEVRGPAAHRPRGFLVSVETNGQWWECSAYLPA